MILIKLTEILIQKCKVNVQIYILYIAMYTEYYYSIFITCRLKIHKDVCLVIKILKLRAVYAHSKNE